MVLDIRSSIKTDKTVPDTVVRKPVTEVCGIKGELCSYKGLGVPTNAFVLKLPGTYRTLSTRYGFKETDSILNAYMPEGLWDFMHEESRDWPETYSIVLSEALKAYDLPFSDIIFLSTGVDMVNQVWSVERYEDIWVACFTTAGVKTNAMRVGVDKASGIERNGKYEKIGTINNIVITNACLDDAAMASSFITVTEAKNVALQELNIHSAYTPEVLATGTGTDQIIMASGEGEKCTYVGGHTKIGEMIAKAVTSSTIAAIKKCAAGAL